MHTLPWFPRPFFSGLFLLIVWSLVWSGLALWYAARRGEKFWFIVFLIVHTAGILEILYLAFVVKIFSSLPNNPPLKRRKSR